MPSTNVIPIINYNKCKMIFFLNECIPVSLNIFDGFAVSEPISRWRFQLLKYRLKVTESDSRTSAPSAPGGQNQNSPHPLKYIFIHPV